MVINMNSSPLKALSLSFVGGDRIKVDVHCHVVGFFTLLQQKCLRCLLSVEYLSSWPVMHATLVVAQAVQKGKK